MAHVVFWAFCVLLGVTLTVQAQWTSTYVAPNTRNHCFPCPAGTRVKEHCTEDLTNSTCAPCPSGDYSDTPNNKPYCKVCRAHCPKSGSVTQNCTATTDLGCRCNDGYHKYPIDHIDPSWTCRKHTTCKEGEGEVFRGNHTHNTKCEKCKENVQFVNKSDPNHPVCQTCMTCAPGIREAKKCSLDHDRECDESQNGTYVNVTSTVPSVTTTADVTDQPSGSLSGAVIFVIVFGVLVVAGIIAGAGLYILTKGNNRIQITEREKIAVVLAIVTGFGLPVVIILLIRAYRHGRGSSEQTYTVVSLANGDAIDAAVSDAAVGDAPGDSAVRDAAGDAAVGDAAAGDAASGDAAVGDAAVGDAAPLLDWSLDFIEGRVFTVLSTYLGNEWRMFITELPGWWPTKANAVIEQSMLNERSVKDQIFACLKAWKQQCTQKVTRRNILSALEASSVKRMDLKQKLETMSATSA